jgi:hypothetical protein
MPLTKIRSENITSTSNLTIDNNTLFVDYSNDRIGIGTTTPAAKLEVNGSINATDFNSTSDIKLKDNINTINNGLEIVTSIDPVSFNWKDSGKKSYGVVAQDIEKLLPEVVSGDDTKHVSYIQLIAFLIAAVKELNDKIEELKNKA